MITSSKLYTIKMVCISAATDGRSGMRACGASPTLSNLVAFCGALASAAFSSSKYFLITSNSLGLAWRQTIWRNALLN